MADYKVGQKVKATTSGEITVVTSDGIWIKSKESSFNTFVHFSNNIEILNPPNWPPLPGDVWEADGELFMVYNSSGVTSMRNASGRPAKYYSETAYSNFDSFKNLNPILAYRKDK